MREVQLSTTKQKKPTNVSAEMDQITHWFRTEYLVRHAALERYKYLGLPMLDSRYALELEAYDKENRLRELQGLEPLPAPKHKQII